MGEPAHLTAEQTRILRAAGQPLLTSLPAEKTEAGVRVKITLKKNAVARLRVLPAPKQEDPGYDYGYYCQE